MPVIILNAWKAVVIIVPAPSVEIIGTAWGWGDGYFGKLANGTDAYYSTPVQTIDGGTEWVQVAGGDHHSLLVHDDGTLWTCGYNNKGQLGDNTVTKRSSPIQTTAGGNSWKQAEGGQGHSAAVKIDATLWSWGFNSSGQLGDGTTTNKSSPVQTVAGGTDWDQVACGGGFTGAVKTDGTLWMWGEFISGRLGIVGTGLKLSPVQTQSGGTDWKQIALGRAHVVTVKTDGTLWTWGANDRGQLGDGTIINKSSPTQTVSGGTDWKQASAGNRMTAAIKTDGTLWMWGEGYLGDGTTLHRSSPVQTISGGTDWAHVACGYYHTSATKTDGTLWGWGSNWAGQLADGTTIDRSSPVQEITGGTDWVYSGCGETFTLAIIYVAPTIPVGELWGAGQNIAGQLGDGTKTTRSSPVQTISGGTDWASVAGGVQHVAAIKTDGTLWLYGAGSAGQLGDNTTVGKSSPVQTISGGTDWAQAECATTATAAIKTDGTLWTWGTNIDGSLGYTGPNTSSPTQTVSGGTDWAQVSCGQFHMAAIKTDGTLWTWGRNSNGQLGDGTTTAKSSPTQTISGGTDWAEVSCGNDYVVAVKTDGTLWSWGSNNKGQLGNNTTTKKSSPIQTVAGGTDWVIADGGFDHTAAIKTDGTLWLWGDSYALGDGTITDRSSPVQTISSGTDWEQVKCGYNITAALKTDGTWWTWGANWTAQLGDGTTIAKSSPVQTVSGGTDWIYVGVGHNTVYALKLSA